jgi:hypothetical protein
MDKNHAGWRVKITSTLLLWLLAPLYMVFLLVATMTGMALMLLTQTRDIWTDV